MSIQYFISFLFVLMLSCAYALVDDIQTDFTEENVIQGLEQKIQELENTVKALESSVQKAGCQEYMVHGYHYDHRFMLAGVAFDNAIVHTEGDDLVYFEMHLAIKAPKDAMILLSPKATTQANDLVFEIGVGIVQNQYTVLRLTKDGPPEVARASTPDILSREKYTKFYIKIANDTLTFGKDGVDEDPIITYNSSSLRTIKYFDLSAWGTIGGKFLFDCPPPKSF